MVILPHLDLLLLGTLCAKPNEKHRDNPHRKNIAKETHPPVQNPPSERIANLALCVIRVGQIPMFDSLYGSVLSCLVSFSFLQPHRKE